MTFMNIFLVLLSISWAKAAVPVGPSFRSAGQYVRKYVYAVELTEPLSDYEEINQIKNHFQIENSTKQKNFTDRFYWKQYDGTIPDDAVPGGTKFGQDTYIGMTYVHPHGPLPSVIYRGDKSTYAHAASKEFKSDVNNLILCAPKDDRPIWKQVNILTVDNLKNCRFIIGGYEVGFALRIGRINLQGEYYTGRVFPKERTCCTGLCIHKDNAPIHHLPDFEILAYCDY